MTNPIIEKFESSNTLYKFQRLDEDAQFEQYNCYKGYCLKYKNGNYPSEFETGDYGWKYKNAFLSIKEVFSNCFGQPFESVYYIWNEECEKAVWEYEGYILWLSTVYTHPKTDGWYIEIGIKRMYCDKGFPLY